MTTVSCLLEKCIYNKDTISRAKAIEALKNDMASLDNIIKGMSANDVRLDAYVSQRNQVNYDIYTINNLPPIQSEAYNRGYAQGYKDAKAEQPEPHWIPVTERLPEDYTDVLVWFEYFRYGSYNRLYQTYGIGTYSAQYDSWMINHESGWHKLRVIAWRPLPEEFKGE